MPVFHEDVSVLVPNGHVKSPDLSEAVEEAGQIPAIDFPPA